MPKRTSHGQAHNGKHTPAYSSWKHAKQRCFNPKHVSYHNYGGRGIVMCQIFSDSFPTFYQKIGDCPEGKTLDRIDTDGHYSCGECEQCKQNDWPFNCKWSTKKEQDRNRRTNKIYTIQGVTGCVVELCEHFGINKYSFYTRLQKGWSVERAFTEPINEPDIITVSGFTGTFPQVANHFGISSLRAFKRIKSGWTHEEAFLTPVRQGNYRTGSNSLREEG